MIQSLPIRTRLTIVYGGLLFLALALSGGAVVILLRYRLYQRLDEALDRRLQGVEAFLHRETTAETAHMIPVELEEYASTQPEGHLIEVRDETGRLLLGSEPVPSPSHFRTRQFALYGRVFHTKASGSLRPVEESVQEMVYLFLGSSPILLLLIGITGYWISKRSLQPVDDMTQAARSISVNNLGERLAVPPSGDELSRLAEAWNEMLGRLEESFARMQRFTADAAHEFRTPLTGLRTTAELALRRPRAPEEYREALSQVITISERMNHLSESLLALARGEDPPAIRTTGRVDIAGLVRGVVAEMQSVLAQKNLQISLLLSEKSVLPGADADGIRRLVSVLIDNAQKYTPAGGKITVSLHETPAEIELEVSDTGCGIPEESLARIFDRFYRIDPSRNRETGGYGLGLAIAQQIARTHHGRIEASSKPGEGASFRLLLPRNGA